MASDVLAVMGALRLDRAGPVSMCGGRVAPWRAISTKLSDLELTNGQFSLMMSLNRRYPPAMGGGSLLGSIALPLLLRSSHPCDRSGALAGNQTRETLPAARSQQPLRSRGQVIDEILRGQALTYAEAVGRS